MKLIQLKRYLILLITAVILVPFLTGCVGSSEEKIADLEFTVASKSEIPKALERIIDEKKKDPFKLTYSNNGNLYIVVGYGEMETGGMNIQVPELYKTQSSIEAKTELVGPTGEEAKRKSYPYIVIKTEDLGLPVVFE